MIKGRYLTLLTLSISGAFVGVLACLFLASEAGLALLTILISITLIITLGGFTWRNARKNGIFDIGVLFSLFFLAYNALLPIEVSLQYLLSHMIELNYPIQFGIEQFTITTFFSLLAGTMYMMGARFKLAVRSSFSPRLLAVKIDGNLSFYAGTILYLFGVLLFFLDYSRIGGYFASMAMDRAIRMNLLSEVRGNLPYIQFILVGLALMAYASSINSKFKLKIGVTIACSLLFILLLIFGGDRRFSLYILLVLFSVYSFVRGPIRLNRRILLAGICAYVLLVIFQATRWMLPLIFVGELSFQTAYQIFINNFSYTLFFPGSTELAGPYLSLLYYATSIPPLLGGTSYLYALPNLLPRSLYPGMKVPTISQDFALQMHEAFYYQRTGIVGFGFNPIAESLANFGYIGPVIVFMFIGLILTLATHLKNNGILGGLILAVISPIAFNLNRADFANAFLEVTYNVALLIAVAIAIWIVQSAFSHKFIVHNCENCKHIKIASRDATSPRYLEGIK